jgi:hypothetical protein
MLTRSLWKCRACRLSWFPAGGAATACPACGGTELGGTLELFHVGIALIALAGLGWLAPSFLGDHPLPAFASIIESPARTEAAPPRHADEVTTVKQEQRHVTVKDRRTSKLTSKKVKKRQKAKKRSQHVQR